MIHDAGRGVAADTDIDAGARDQHVLRVTDVAGLTIRHVQPHRDERLATEQFLEFFGSHRTTHFRFGSSASVSSTGTSLSPRRTSSLSTVPGRTLLIISLNAAMLTTGSPST